MVQAAIEYTKERIKPEAKANEDYGASSATGYKGASSATGNYGASSATGYKGKSAAENQNSVAVAWGPEAMAKGVKGSTLVLAEWKRIDNDAWYWKEETWDFIGSLMVRVDGEKVKENTWYTLKNGELVEVEDE